MTYAAVDGGKTQSLSARLTYRSLLVDVQARASRDSTHPDVLILLMVSRSSFVSFAVPGT